MLISSDREIYHSPLIRIQNRRRVFCAGFVCLEAMQAWHGFLFKIPRDCSVFYTLAIPTHIRISWCFATLLCSCVCGALILSAMHMQAWHGFLFKIPRDCSVFYTLAIPTHIRISWCFATLLCSCVCGALILSAMHMQAWHGFRIVPLVSYNSSPRSAGCGFRGIH